MWARIKYKFRLILMVLALLVEAASLPTSKDALTMLHATTIQKPLLTMLLVRSQLQPMWIVMAIAWWPLTVRVRAVALPRLTRLVSAVVLAQQTPMPMAFVTMQTTV